jgi:phosphoribosylaminoimidazole carboxylase PurE protein
MSEPKVLILMGSPNDMPAMEKAAKTLDNFGVKADLEVSSAHRNPEKTADLAKEAEANGYGCIIAGAGLAAALPGVVAAHTMLPVIGVPLSGGPLKGQDSLLSIVQMPKGVPVATVGIDNTTNAGLLAACILALKYPSVSEKWIAFREEQTKK